MLEEKGVGLNQGYLIPHGNIRLEVMGLENKKADPSDLEKMREIISRVM